MQNIMMKAGNACLKSTCVNWMVIVLALTVVSCSRQADQLQHEDEAAKKVKPQTELATCCWVGLTNEVGNTIEVYDPADASWTSTTRKWSWKPSTALSYNATSEIPLWAAPTDIKVRNNTVFASTAQVITATSYRFATIARYTGTGLKGQKLWVMGFNDTTSLHAMEILPDGNCVVASAGKDGGVGWIRIYSSSQPSPNHGVNTQYYFPAAHGVVWDNTHQILWALGNQLRKYRYNPPVSGGTITNPKLHLDTTYSVLPSPWGHDLSANPDNSDQLLLSTNGGTYTFHISTGKFDSLPGAAFRTFVKSVSRQPDQNILIETQPSSGCPLAPGNNWCTSVVNFYNATTGAAAGSRTVSGAAIYKAKAFDPNYY